MMIHHGRLRITDPAHLADLVTWRRVETLCKIGVCPGCGLCLGSYGNSTGTKEEDEEKEEDLCTHSRCCIKVDSSVRRSQEIRQAKEEVF